MRLDKFNQIRRETMLKTAFVLLLLPIGITRADTYNVSDARTKGVLESLGKGAEAKLCKTDDFGQIDESCFFIVDGDLYFTPVAFDYWIDDPILPEGRVTRLVSNYYVEDPEPLEDTGFIVFAAKKSGGKSGGKTGGGSASNNGSGNNINISIGSGNGNSGGGDRSCRSCHAGVHPGFGGRRNKNGDDQPKITK